MKRSGFLVGGMVLGALFAVFHIARVPQTPPMPTDAVAWVNGREISADNYARALSAVAADRKDGQLRDSDRERVMQRLIDQELLIDRAIELDLHERDPQIRNQLSAAMIDLLVQRAEGAADSVTDDDLRAFYREEAFRFRRPGAARIEYVGDSGGALPLPAGFLLDKDVEQRLGPSAVEVIAALAPGETAVLAVASRDLKVRLVERREGEARPFEEVRETVHAAYVRAQSEAEVRRFLLEARKRSDIRVEEVP